MLDQRARVGISEHTKPRHDGGHAVIEVDDLRQLVEAGAAAPWEGDAGARQSLLGARNACALAANFLAEDIDVVITDVLTPETAALYREELPGCRVVRLRARWMRRNGARRHDSGG